METRANYVAVGAFVVLLLAAFFVAVLWLARVEFDRRLAVYDIYFGGSVTGLAVGASVRYSGVDIGRVTEIRLDPQNVERVRVTVEVDPDAVIKEDAVAALQYQGVTGIAFVEISGGSRDAPPLRAREGERTPVIASRPSQLEKVFASAPEVLERFIVLADRLAEFLDERNRQAIGQSLENVRAVTAAAAGRAADIDAVLGEGAAAARELRGTLAAARPVLDELRETLVAGTQTLEQVRRSAAGFEGIDRNLAAALNELTTTTQKLGMAVGQIEAMVRENRGPIREFSQLGLNELYQLVAESRVLVSGLTRLSNEIERDPARFFFGDRREGYRPR